MKTSDLTERKFVRGWNSAAPKVRIRQAGVADLAALERVAAIAEVPFEDPLREALSAGTAGAGLRAGLRGGQSEYMRYMATRFHAEQKTNPMRAYLDGALVLAAEHPEQGVVGGLIAYPPVNVAEDVLDMLERSGASPEQLHKTMLLAGMFLTRVKALAVVESARGHNLGGSLLKAAKVIYFHLGYQTIYGALPPTPGLDEFYRRAGFHVHDHGQPLDLSVLFGHAMFVSPDTGERIFTRNRPRNSGVE